MFKSTKKFLQDQYRGIKKYMRNKYVKLMEFFTNCFMSLAFTMMYYLMNLKGKNLQYIEPLATRFASMAAGMVRDVIVLKGKNPDYVPPPPAPPPSLQTAVERTIEENMKKRPRVMELTWLPGWVSDSFDNLANHPVLQSRRAFETKENKRKQSINKAPESAPTIFETELTVEEANTSLEEMSRFEDTKD